MSWTFVACVGIAFVWLGLFYLWGRSFLTFIKAERDIASSIAFGYLLLQFIYQIIYLPFYFTRGSFRAVSYIWLGIVAIVSVLLCIFLRKHSSEQKLQLKPLEKVGICLASVLVLGLAVYVSLHVPYYGQDTRTYINTMNESYYRDALWFVSGKLSFHYGMCSMFQLFTVPALLTGIKPYYLSLFTIRVAGTCLLSLIVYRTGIIIFRKPDNRFCWPALILSVLVPYLLMFWGSMYTAEFFYWRINEAKGFCQFILLPLGFSVFLEMFKKDAERKKLWKEQLMVGLAAVSVSASSLMPYLFLVFLGTFALLVYDKLKEGWRTVGCSMVCMLPNLLYLAIYILEKEGTIVL